MTTTSVTIEEYRNFIFKNGKLNGKSLGWYDNGQLIWYQELKNGKLHGKYIWYYVDGIIMYNDIYANGVKK